MEDKKETKNKEIQKPKQFDFLKNNIKRFDNTRIKPTSFHGTQHRG